MSADTIRRAILTALAATPLVYAGCKDPETPIPVPPPTEVPRDTPPVDAAAPTPMPPTSAAPPPSASASLPTPIATSAETSPTTVVAAPSVPAPPAPKPADCKTTRAYCIPSSHPPPSFGNVAPPPPGSPDATHYDAQGCVARAEMPTSCSGMTFLSGPVKKKAECCYQVCQGPVPPCGRPFFVDGDAALAPLETRADWTAADDRAIGGTFPRSAEARARLRDAWLADARMEHASIASFARLSLELLAVGAPPDLVQGAHDAARDEIVHARLAFGLASAIGEESFGPGPFAAAASASLAGTIADVVAATVRDGCVGETFAALVAAEARDTCVEPRSKAVLARIADDEAAHAAYAFRVVAWGVREGGAEAARAAEVAFSSACAALGAGGGGLSGADLGPYGRLGHATLSRLSSVAIRDILAPSMAAVLVSARRGDAASAEPALHA